MDNVVEDGPGYRHEEKRWINQYVSKEQSHLNIYGFPLQVSPSVRVEVKKCWTFRNSGERDAAVLQYSVELHKASTLNICNVRITKTQREGLNGAVASDPHRISRLASSQKYFSTWTVILRCGRRPNAIELIIIPPIHQNDPHYFHFRCLVRPYRVLDLLYNCASWS